MRAYIAFTKKEWVESIRTYRLFILLAVFFVLGIMNPLTAKLTPTLLANFAPEGMVVEIPTPTALDSWIQFHKNVPQMGLFVLVIMFSGAMTGEYNKGTFVNMVTKGLKRRTIIFAKFTMSVLLWTMSLLLCFGLSSYYTAYYWNLDGFTQILQSVICVWLFGILLLSMLLFFGAVVRNGYACMMFTGGMVVIFFLLNMLPSLQKYNPVYLVGSCQSLITGELVMSDFTASIIISIVFVVLSIVGSVLCFDRKKL
ncbi:ABC transporter permease [Anaerosporobacter faecicola]|uniref:ABC transporter permease n=1 Tax=Anaerosporobacter faecicola TaxID=2718714 RepID=UPI00143C414F|nr:ABC transporter permease [Anaerosporobacter faecicola]